ncbi:nucleotide-binding universal stress UspA family protein [Halopolyspora algeriensis]|uniref:Nucleotide-binding universal stress UspA family protein n=1 Tax=Halopolyspora algeriensis TaxID=1500506 RepID=A0A368VYL7_9ACTN|nr:universal stress protein [Halopolyspora algeriensis]RCW45922.1 nucleotide-binding universal stress UspA family protein [Halopolyspora algeriensis]
MATAVQAITAGIDGSNGSFHAVSWAAAEASRRHARLHLVVVDDDPQRAGHAEDVMRYALEQCRAREPEVVVTDEVVSGHPVEQLLQHSRSAHMLVLGSRGLGGFAGALLGSVSAAVATHSSCPVVVVHDEEVNPSGPVVVGLDNSPASDAALRFAVESAAQRHCEVLAVQAWHEEELLAVPLPPSERDQVRQRIEHTLADQVARVSETWPAIPVRRSAPRGHPVAVLTDAARDAQLLVVGHRGRGGFSGLFLGSVAAGVLHHARCPVVVVRTVEGT